MITISRLSNNTICEEGARGRYYMANYWTPESYFDKNYKITKLDTHMNPKFLEESGYGSIWIC